MLYLDKYRLETILANRGISINKLAEVCGISRQTIYNMYENIPVFNTTFEKIRQYLNCDFRAITSDTSVAQEIMKKAPERVSMAAYLLSDFARENKSDLLLYNTNGKGKSGHRFDWNFVIYFPKKENDGELRIIRQNLIERTAPYRIEIINLNRAPLWLKLLVKNNYIRLYGNSGEDQMFYSDN